MSKIRIDVDALANLSKVLAQKRNDFTALEHEMQSLNDSIQASWAGSAQIAYREMTGKFHQDFGKLSEILDEFRKYADETAQKFAQTDSECAARIINSF